jgi:hypothetical protein
MMEMHLGGVRSLVEVGLLEEIAGVLIDVLEDEEGGGVELNVDEDEDDTELLELLELPDSDGVLLVEGG